MSAAYLIVDDDDAFRSRLARAIRERGFSVHEAKEGTAALDLVRAHPIDRIITDLKMPGLSGVELVPQLLKLRPTAQVVVLTGYGSITTTVQCVKDGAVNYLTKPVDVDRLLASFHGTSGKAEVAFRTPSLASVEWNHIHRVLEESKGNVSKAAKVLGLHRRTLQRKLQKEGL